MPGVMTVYRWETTKLVHQKRTYLGLGAAVVTPLIFIAALAIQGGDADGLAFGGLVRVTGLAIPLVGLAFGSIWLLPLITALVAGDIVAAEDGNGTLKTILTRSLDRGQIFLGKVLAALTYAALALAVMGLVGLVAGTLFSGFEPLQTLSGTTVPAGRALALVAASYAVYLLPLLSLATIAVLLSTVTRNSAAAVVGTLLISLLLQLVGVLPGLESVRPYLLTSQFDAWQGLLRDPLDAAPIVRAAWICALHAVPAGVAAYLVFLRRDVTGG